MPDSRIVSIHKKIAELIAVDYSSGYSGIDFTNRVIRAVEIEPIMVPNACVKFIDSKEDYGPTMGRYSGDAIFEVYAFVNGKDPIQRSDQAINICSDMIKSITANRQLSLGSLVDDVLCSFKAIEGDIFGLTSTGIGYIEIIIKYQTSDGA